MRARALVSVVAGVSAMAAAALAPLEVRAQADRRLREPSEFAEIRNRQLRSQTLFIEAGKVLLHPRCLNCHPDGNRPLQGPGAPHEPPVERGDHGHGVPGMQCSTCHQRENFDPGGVPGHPKWELAPRQMAWRNRSLHDICEQVQDPKRNRTRNLDKIVEHVSYDTLVGWAWNPGAGREPAPGTQAIFGALIKAWADSGAACPPP